jgi:hypothetical protein
MVGPNPAMPSRTLLPNNAIQTPDRTNSLGKRTADGLPGCVSKYNSARWAAAILFILFAVISLQKRFDFTPRFCGRAPTVISKKFSSPDQATG